MEVNQSLDRLHSELGLKRLNPTWAKAEILGGLLAAAIGVLLMAPWAARQPADILDATAGIALFVFGGYLAMAGHRSHLYQSNNLLAAHLAEEIRKLSPKV
jgi:hypothetical protein